MVTAQDFAKGKFSLGWCPQNLLVALDSGTEVPAGLGLAQKYTDSGLGGGQWESLRRETRGYSELKKAQPPFSWN